MVFCFGGRCDNRSVKPLILDHAFAKLHPAEVAHAAVVIGPHRGVGASGQVASDDYLHRQHLQLPRDRNVGVGDFQHLVGHDIAGFFEPVMGYAIENGTLHGNGSQHVVEGTLPIGGDENAFVRKQIHVAHLALAVVL